MKFNDIRDQISALRERLITFIDSLPDVNDGVTPLNKKGTCGVVSFSTIQKNHGILCPGYYLNHNAKKELRRLITNTKLESLDRVIEKIIQTARVPSVSSRPLYVNPEFTAKLKEMWNNEKND